MRSDRILASALMISLAALSSASAQKSAASSSQSPQEVEARALLNLEDDWTKGLMNRDSMIFKRLLAPGFVYTENAQMMTGPEVIKGVMAGEKVDRAWNQYMHVHEFGPVAVVTGVLAVTSRGKKGPHTTRYRFTDTWLNSAGKWQVVAAQDYVIPDGIAK